MSFNLSASSEEKTTFPLAAPGDAGSPFAITLISLFSSNVGCNNVSRELGSILRIASFFEINFYLTMSTAILTADLDVLFHDFPISLKFSLVACKLWASTLPWMDLLHLHLFEPFW